MTIADIEFHDLPVNTITIDFTTGSVLVSCAIYDEGKQCHKNVSVQFTGVDNFKPGEVGSLQNDYIEIFSADVTEAGDGSYSIVISFITGFSKPGFDMSFTYQNVSVVVIE